ncbi:hypothetical protein CEE37_11335 [candidate division LCP-89 bacterium B3_LCP]|uniref:Secretion system C-terminal sorting domain-containing protein n=1 Tax=candidate division LCP-89 bacterium B3_LCP TaxID=2012998 RepID=A0A532UY37_UNCL8|nr:MAG: hypothetical protein CEE37_11335 [candidate division LCP-89 bacterium B3_LCP]
MMRVFKFCLLLLPMSVALSQAQIVLRAPDFPSTAGMVFEYYSEDGDSIPVNVGVPGGPQTWDYAIGDTSNISTDTYLDPSVAPPELSRANLVIETSQLNQVGLTEAGIMYAYLHPMRLIVGGVLAEIEGEELLLIFNPYLNAYNLPLYFGRTWSNTIDYDEIFEFPEYDIRIELHATMDSEVDAYGTTIVPLGRYESLRMRNDVIYDLTVYIRLLWVWVPIYEEHKEAINYEWRAADVGTVLHITSDSMDPYFSYAKSVRRLMNSTTTAGDTQVQPVASTVQMPETIELICNYPNPFNGETVISYSLTESANIDLRIFDVMGRQVEVLDQSHHQAGVSEVTWKPQNLSAGLYFMRLQAGDQVEQVSLVYLK